MDSISKVLYVSKVSNSGRSIPKILKYIVIPLNIGIELSQVLQYFDISNIEPALVYSEVCTMYSEVCTMKYVQ